MVAAGDKDVTCGFSDGHEYEETKQIDPQCSSHDGQRIANDRQPGQE